MPTVSGRVVYNAATPEQPVANYIGIVNIPVVLQAQAPGNALLAVRTDANGYYAFINVPAGTYNVIERYDQANAVLSPGNFRTASAGDPIAAGLVPPPSAGPAGQIPEWADELHTLSTLEEIIVEEDDSTVTVHPFVTTPYDIAVVGNEYLIYQLIVTNHGEATAVNVTLEDTLPPELTAVEFSVDGGQWQEWNGGAIILLNLGDLEIDEFRTVRIRGVVVADYETDFIRNYAIIDSDTESPDESQNEAEVWAIVADTNNVTITKIASSVRKNLHKIDFEGFK
jgi:uncharacterized repeat protein (TIGR01451 family)